MTQPEEPSAPDELARRLQLLELQLKQRELETATKPKAWWVTIVEFLALPAAVLAIVIQLTQASGNVKTETKTEAETTKARVDTAKALLETEKLQLELAALRAKGPTVATQDVERLVPRLEESVERLRALQSQQQQQPLATALAKFVLLWILFHAIGLLFDVIQQVWGSLLAGTLLYVFNKEHPRTLDEQQERKRHSRRKLAQWAGAILSPVPSVLRWSLQLSVFVALMIPLFDEVARSMGSGLVFETLVRQTSQLELGNALATLKQLLFGTAG